MSVRKRATGKLWIIDALDAVRLVGRRLVVRETKEEDVPFIHEYASDADLVRFMSWGPITLDETRAFVLRQLRLAREVPRTEYGLAIELPQTGEMIGRVRLTVSSVPDKRGDLGYVLRRGFWGQGYATEAVRLVLHLALGELQLHRVEATCSPANMESIRVLEKVGMHLEGRLRENVHVRGAWRDSLLYAVLEGEQAP
jgi:ribosomal-protein-alanine N-acetyltransferase